MKKDRYWLYMLLFLATVVTTLLAGTELVTGKSWLYAGVLEPSGQFVVGFGGLGLGDLWKGWSYSFCFLAFLTVHEFGHYLTAVYHKVKTSLPYYIPIFIPLIPMNIGSFGAVIRLRQVPETTRKFFDIGVAGPLAGFVVSVLLLVWGFTHLPPAEHIYTIHPEYEQLYNGFPTLEQIKQRVPEENLAATPMIGTSLLFEAMAWLLVEDPCQIPPPFELMHYPFLFVGFITLFFTALNLLPIGQLDGGHVTYGLFGLKVSGIIARIAVVCLIFFGGTGIATIESYDDLPGLGMYLLYLVFIYNLLFAKRDWWVPTVMAAGTLLIQLLIMQFFQDIQPGFIWLIYSFLGVRLIGVDHPKALLEQPLTPGRKVLGWLAIVIFILCFTPNPIYTLV